MHTVVYHQGRTEGAKEKSVADVDRAHFTSPFALLESISPFSRTITFETSPDACPRSERIQSSNRARRRSHLCPTAGDMRWKRSVGSRGQIVRYIRDWEM